MQNQIAAMLTKFGERYPGCWLEVDKLRAREKSAWPPYCFLPTFGAHWVIGGGKKLPYAERFAKIADMQRLAALSAWRVTQSIYRFDEILFDALWETPVEKVPTELFRRLPEWCIYIEIPKAPYRGAFVHLDHYGVPLRDQLRIVLDKIDGSFDDLEFIALHLDTEDIYEGVQSVLTDAEKDLEQNGYKWKSKVTVDSVTQGVLGNVASLVLYLCSLDADFDRPLLTTPKRTKDGLRMFPPPAPKVIEVGALIGAALKKGMKALSENGEETGGSVRPHVRRAHHHHYWTGPKTKQERVVKWIWPILVNVDKGEIGPTIRPVKE